MSETPNSGFEYEERQWYLPSEVGLDVENSEADKQLYIDSYGDRVMAEMLLTERELFSKTKTGEISHQEYEVQLDRLHKAKLDRIHALGIEFDSGT